MGASGSRPAGVTLVGILIVLAGLGLIANGVVGLVNGGNGGAGILVSIVVIVAGAIYLFVAKGVWNGNNGARLIVTIFTVIALVGSVAAMLTEEGEFLISAVQALVALVILVLLFSGKARTYFG